MGNGVPPPAPPSIPPDHPFLRSSPLFDTRPSACASVRVLREPPRITRAMRTDSKSCVLPMRTDPQRVLREPLIPERASISRQRKRRLSARGQWGQEPFFSKEDNSPRSPARRDAQGMSANSQSASEQGGSAKRERALRTRLASSGGQLTKRTEQGARRAQARATCSGSEALVLTAENRQIFQDIPCRELSGRAQHAKPADALIQRGRP